MTTRTDAAGTTFGVLTDYEYTATHKRERLVIWSGPFYSVYQGEAYTLPKGDGYMIRTYNDDRVRVTCPTPRTDANFREVDDRINEALNAYETARGSTYLAR